MVRLKARAVAVAGLACAVAGELSRSKAVQMLRDGHCGPSRGAPDGAKKPRQGECAIRMAGPDARLPPRLALCRSPCPVDRGQVLADHWSKNRVTVRCLVSSSFLDATHTSAGTATRIALMLGFEHRRRGMSNRSPNRDRWRSRTEPPLGRCRRPGRTASPGGAGRRRASTRQAVQ